MIYKENDLKLEDLDEVKGIVRHFWSGYGNEDSDGDIIRQGAFKRSIDQRGPGSTNPRIKFLWQHRIEQVRGTPQKFEDKDVGLLATTKIILGRPNQEGEDLIILYREKGITEHSIGFDQVRRDENDRRVIIEGRLWEGSAVTFGANPLTPFVDVKGVYRKSDREGRLEYLQTQIDRADRLKNCGISDELSEEFEMWQDLLIAFKSGLVEKHSGRKDPSLPDTPTDEEKAAILETTIKLQSLKRQRERGKIYAFSN